MQLPFDTTYTQLPERFYAMVAPTKVRAPAIVKVNHRLAAQLGLDADRLDSAEGAELLAGNVVAEGSQPIALAYAGHQFGSFVRQLGDGRALLLGEVIGVDGRRRDVQLKGSGRTPFSRAGDGRAALGPVLREYVVSEAMAALGIPTTRALAIATTGEPVYREQVLPGAILTRVAASHLRVGTFEFVAARDDREGLEALTAYALERHYPAHAGTQNRALALVAAVAHAQSELVARWMGVGFVHGVMNTDNMSISGETIDYGPCAFLDDYDANKCFSSIDTLGRYAFSNQPRIAQWNLARLAEALLPLVHEDEDEAIRLATEELDRFPARFADAYARTTRAKLGLFRGDDADREHDRGLAADLFERLAANHVDLTLFFRRLCAAAEDSAGDASVASLFEHPGAFHDWAARWRTRLATEDVSPSKRAGAMRKVNPAFIPRNHRVEEMIDAAVGRNDFGPFETLVAVLERPYDDQPEHTRFREPPTERIEYRTFCGT